MPTTNRNWTSWLLLIAVFALALLPRVLNLGAFWGTDERYHWELSNAFLQNVLAGNWSDTIPQGMPGVTLHWIESGWIMLRYWLGNLSGQGGDVSAYMALERPLQGLAQRQVAVAFINALLVTAVFWFSRLIFNTKVALLGAILIALDPFFLAESRLLRFEALVTGLMTLSVLTALAHAKTGRIYLLILSAVIAGLAALTKISAIIIIPFIGLILLLTYPRLKNSQTERPFLMLILALLLWLAIGLSTFWLVWPAMWTAPATALQTVFEFAAEAGEAGLDGRGVFFWGQVFPDGPGPFFYPVALAYRTTPLVLLGLALAIFALIKNRGWAKAKQPERYWQWWGIVLLLAYALFFAFVMTIGVKKYDRYLMPIFPTLSLIAGFGLTQLGLMIARKVDPGRLKRWLWPLMIGVVIIIQAYTALPHLPYYYTYYNPLFGGIQSGAKVIRVGFAEGLDEVGRYFESLPNPQDISVASGNSSKLNGIFSGQTIALDNLSGEWVQADYVFLYISQLQRGKHHADILAYFNRTEPLHITTLHGFDYATVYPGPAMQYHVDSPKLEGRGDLWGYTLSATDLNAGETLSLELIWRNEGKLPGDDFWVRLVDIDGYVWAEDVVAPKPGFEDVFNSEGIVEGTATLNLPPGMLPGQYALQMGYTDTSNNEVIGLFELPQEGDDILVSLPEEYAPLSLPAEATALDLKLNDELTLRGFALSNVQTSPGSSPWLTLYWQAETDIEHDYVVGLQLLDQADNEATFWLGRPARSVLPTNEWRQNQVVQDPWLLTLPPDIAPGTYTLLASFYDAETTDLVDTINLQTLTIK